jgi:immune inhibitor A
LFIGLFCLAAGLVVLRPDRWLARQLDGQGEATPTQVASPTRRPAATVRPVRPTRTATLVSPVTATVEPLVTPEVDNPPQPLAPEAANSSLAAVTGAQVPARDIFALAKGFGRIPADAARTVGGGQPEYQIGDRLEFFVSDIHDNSHHRRETVLHYQTAHANWWVQEGFQVAAADLERSAQVFEERTYPTNRDHFGSEWSPGMDNDVRLHIFLGEVPGVAGYYSSADEFPRSINPFSNEKEMFYINLENARPGEEYFDGILAHEFQHMIHWNEDGNEDLWVNEGLSELAADLNRFPVGGFANIFARTPDLQLTTWSADSAPHYGASYLFMRYLHDRFGAEMIREIVAEQRNGASGIETVLAAHQQDFDAVFADWVVANYLNDPQMEQGRFGYGVAQEIPSLVLGETHQRFPVEGNDSVHQYAADYLTFEAERGSAGTLWVDFSGDETVALLPATGEMGDFFLWSHRGDDAAPTATRRFDLTGLSAASLRFEAWYDLESGWDYGYVAVSTDGGQQWEIVAAETTTDDDPSGNSFGPAFTGRSGVGAEVDEDGPPASWIQERVDLTPFVGQEVLVRFQMITDDALNRPGLVVDDVEVPELGYKEDFERGAEGWEMEGFVRVSNDLPQQYLLQAILQEEDGTVRVERPTLDQTNRGRVVVPDFGSRVRSVVLVVSGVTPVTTEASRYQYRAAMEP